VLVLLSVSWLCSSLHAQHSSQTDLNSFTTAEKDSVQLALRVIEPIEEVGELDSAAEVNYSWTDTSSAGLYDQLSVPEGIACYSYNICIDCMDMIDNGANSFTPSTPEVSLANYQPMECNVVNEFSPFDYEYYLYIQRLRTIAEMNTRHFIPQHQELAIHHPASDSHAGILPPETRIALPESRKRSKNNSRA
jgi:hypothetical protein